MKASVAYTTLIFFSILLHIIFEPKKKVNTDTFVCCLSFGQEKF